VCVVGRWLKRYRRPLRRWWREAEFGGREEDFGGRGKNGRNREDSRVTSQNGCNFEFFNFFCLGFL
jgi:hypothetical protein